MKTILQPFPIFVYQNFIEEKNYISIKNDINNLINNHQSEINVIPQWSCNTKSTFESKNIDNKLLNIDNLKKSIYSHTENYFKTWEFSKDLSCKINGIWFNIAGKNEYQEFHHHHDNLFSGVIYIQSPPNSGEIEFLNPLSSEAILMKKSIKFTQIYKIAPIESMILLFPSWLHHRVLPNNSPQDRISISFNIKAEYIN